MKKSKRIITDLILVKDPLTGTLKLIKFPKNDPKIWDKLISNKSNLIKKKIKPSIW